VKGDEPLSIAWSLQGEQLSSGPDLTTSQIGSRTSLLMISSVSYRHTGRYTCTASNAAGSDSSSAELKVNGNNYLKKQMKAPKFFNFTDGFQSH